MSLFDGGCFAGRDLETGLERPIEEVIATFDRYGVNRGVVGSYQGIYQDVREGAREVRAWADRFPERVVPLAALNPARYGEPPMTLLRELKEGLGIRVVGLFSEPSYYPVVWDSPACRAVGEAADALGLPLQAGLRDESELAALARSWGGLSVPVMVRWMDGRRYKTLASEAALAGRLKNFLFDAGTICSVGTLQAMAMRIGATRLFFASNAPRQGPAAPHAALHSAGLDPREREAVERGTLEKALGLPAMPARKDSLFDGDVWKELLARPKVDVHWHPDHWNLGEPGLSDKEQAAAFERFGVRAVLMSSVLALNHDLAAGNGATAARCGRDPRAFGLIVVNPRRPAESLAEIEKYKDNPRFAGIKTIQDVFGLGLDDPLYGPLLKRAEALKLPVVAHLTGMAGAARRHPSVTFLATHANWGRAAGLLDLRNVHFDFSMSHALREETQLARFIKAAGAERVLFGSDGPLVSPAWSLAKLLEEGGLQEAETEMVLRGNALRVFPRMKARSER